MEFIDFNRQLQAHVKTLTDPATRLFVTDVDKDVLWNLYLDSFDPDDNPVFRERREYDCSCCRHFVKEFGAVVAIVDGAVKTIWDFQTADQFVPVVEALAEYVRSRPIVNIYLAPDAKIGTPKSHEGEGTDIRTWHHFHVVLPSRFVHRGSETADSVRGQFRTSRTVFKRALEELTPDSIQTVLELTAQGSLYRGDEWKVALTQFAGLQQTYLRGSESEREMFTWCIEVPPNVSHIRNHAVGTLLIDLSANVDVDEAVRKYEAVVAPTNYRRPKPIFTKKMLEDAQKTVEELGLTDSLGRRFATLDDISAGDTLFVDRDAKRRITGGVFEEMAGEVAVSPKNFSRAEEVPVDRFLRDVLPGATHLEVLLENRHAGNLVSLLAPTNPGAPSMFKWPNGFSWAYTGSIADSLREKVKAAGGRVDGVLRFSHSWNHIGRNASLMDLHVFLPGSGKHRDGCHDNYPDGPRVGWNRRQDPASGGIQDVDYVNEAPVGYVPVENTTFPTMTRLKEGTYTFKIHNWRLRSPTTSGFKAEIEFGGQVFEFEVERPLKDKEWITVATAELKNGVFTLHEALPASESKRTLWNLPTGQFHRVQFVSHSPNHWEGSSGLGNKHLFFMLSGCVSDETPNGFFNEFLRPDLEKHRRVFEALGSKMRATPSQEQLSGLGFSSTKRDHLICRVTGRTTRVVKVAL